MPLQNSELKGIFSSISDEEEEKGRGEERGEEKKVFDVKSGTRSDE